MTQQEWNIFITGSDLNSIDEETYERLSRSGFHDSRGAARVLRRIAQEFCRRDAFSAFFPHLWIALNESAGPDRVLGSFERFLFSAADAADTCQFLAEHPRLVEILVKIFSSSQFLTDILLRNPEYFEDLMDLKRLARPKSVEHLVSNALSAASEQSSTIDQLDGVRRFQRRELLRIGVCDLLDLYDMPAATRQLSNLADSVVQACLVIVNRPAPKTDGFVVIGMGKLGGQELNYSSDIDFLFLAVAPSPAVTRVGEKLIDALARVTTEGFLYRVDMRLRPWGKVGPLVSSPDGFIAYLNKHALLWEKQALLKARVIAGDRAVGEEFLRRARPFIHGGSVDIVRADVFAMKQRMEAFLLQKGRKWGDVKLGEGSIRDVEFCVQFLQLAYGASRPQLFNPNTLESLNRLTQAGLVTPEEQRVLSDGYIFLRTIEHHLQMMDYRQTHTLPEDSNAIANLALRLGFTQGEVFLARYHQHSAAIRQIFLNYMGNMDMRKSKLAQPASASSSQPQDIDQHLARMSPSYAETFTEEEIARHAALASLLDTRRLAAVEGRPLPDGTWQVTIVAYDFPGELSIICGLMVVYGMDIVKGDVFTYESGQEAAARDHERKIVDAFCIQPVRGEAPSAGTWLRYEQDLEGLLQMVRAGQRREARGELAKRVVNSLYGAGHHAANAPQEVLDEPGLAARTKLSDSAPLLTPVEIVFDNDSSDLYTVLHIQASDTTGFLYEFTNALAIYRIYIVRVTVDSVGSRIRDTLFVTDEQGKKIQDPDRQRELRAATVLIKHFTHLLPFSPNPESALLHFREFIGQLFKRPNWTTELASLERPEVLQALARLLGVSDFLWDDFLRMQYANLFPVVRDVDALDTAKSRSQLQEELESVLQEAHPVPRPLSDDVAWYEVLNDFKDREMFRIDMRHILGHTQEFWDFATELTDLAEVVVNAAFHLCHEDLRTQYGTPLLENGAPSLMSICALGKCGGCELGFASDIELMFVYSGNGRTSGPQIISSTEFYEKLVTAVVRAIRARREGIFEIDLQLRPYGKAGSLSVSVESFKKYFSPSGAAWAYERQALVKLRPIAGDTALGDEISKLRDSFIYNGEPFDATAMRAMRERQVRHLVTGGMFNLKYSPGGLVDVEYLIQGLQITHGLAHTDLRQTNTREAMAMLEKVGIISPEDHSRLRKAHTFLRWMIDSLRVVRGNARDVTVPLENSEEFAFLGRRMPYGSDPSRLLEALARYTRDVQELNRRLLV
jgi:[glutamine synthetase] adenylyltransferase / [glutamine synthetase]-adenylyl-L-tyrosine phosphorylase